ncbi:MAG: hypothetical protein HXX80_02080 [Nitrososphaerales archaeon]|nr:hypothetical protein [Nitrososphaerales archaeon]
MPWSAERTNTFRISCKQLSVEYQRRVDGAIIQLMSSDDPRNLGYRKIGRWEGSSSTNNIDAYMEELGQANHYGAPNGQCIYPMIMSQRIV